jgi:hypothetical protein
MAETTDRSAAAKKAAATRAANRGTATRKTTASRTKASATRTRTSAAKQAADVKNAVKSPVGRAGEIAETAVLVPVGAALISRDRAKRFVDELRDNYGTRAKTRSELRRYERRGTRALKTIERDAQKTRQRIERELRQGRTRLEKDVRAVLKDVETRTGPVVKNVELVGARVENAVQSGRTAATKATTTVQERFAGMV